jgi:hypothetical protein
MVCSSGAFCSEFQRVQPPLMCVVHRGRLIKVEGDSRRSVLRLLGYHFTTVRLPDDQPGVIGPDPSAISKPGQTAVGDVFVYLAADRES